MTRQCSSGRFSPCGTVCSGWLRPTRRINESLDFGTVLQGVLDNARALTNARYGGISLVDDAGQMRAVEPSQNSTAR